MPVSITFSKTKSYELIINRELTEEEIKEIKEGTFDPELYEHNSDCSYSEEDLTNFDIVQMEFGEGADFAIIENLSDIDYYEDYLKNKEEL